MPHDRETPLFYRSKTTGFRLGQQSSSLNPEVNDRRQGMI
jgi:hypothetical protein